MNCSILVVALWLIIVPALVKPVIDAVETRSVGTQMQIPLRCIQGAELSESLATLKLQEGPEVARVHESLLTKARTSTECRTQVVEALITALEQATKDKTNQNEKFYLWQHGAGLLADLKAIEALDLLIANINITDGWSASLSEYHVPALAAILKIGAPAIPKLQTVLSKDSDSSKRLFAALAIAYIGGSQARKALTSALPSETDPCVKKFVSVSLEAFNNKAKPNHISSGLNGKWLSAFYCR
jgi:hypothetical protein